MQVEFFYDVVCPYAYLASTRVEEVLGRAGASVRWRPVLLGGLFRHVGAPQRPADSMAQARARLNDLDMQRWAELWGVPLSMPDEHPRRTVDAMRLLVAAPEPVRVGLSRDLFSAYWVEGADVSDREVLAAIARRHGVDVTVIDTARAREGLFASTAEAAELGAFGVPTFAVGERIVWGQDRLGVVRRLLGDAVDLAAPLREETVEVSGAKVRFFHDFSSPFSYLASTRIKRICAQHGATLQWTPILLGALFRAIGTPDVPLFEMSEAKRRYIQTDLHDWADAWGVPFRFPSHFPMRTVLPLRVALVEPSATAAIYRAAWGDDVRIDEPGPLGEVLTDAGFDAESILRQASSQPIKDALRDNTEAARVAGACGVPTFEVRLPGRDPLLLWGQDRLGMLATALRGWTPACG